MRTLKINSLIILGFITFLSCEQQEDIVANSHDLSSTPENSAAVKKTDVSSIWDFATGMEIPDAYSKLTRTNEYVLNKVSTHKLDPNAVYTVWVVVFNNPEHCNDNGCGEDDLFNEDGTPISNSDGTFGLPGINGSVFGGAGRLADANGDAQFEYIVQEGEAIGEVLFGPGLLDAMGAEIHIVLRTHGEVIPGSVPDQLSTFGGGCETNDCEDQQFAVHK